MDIVEEIDNILAQVDAMEKEHKALCENLGLPEDLPAYIMESSFVSDKVKSEFVESMLSQEATSRQERRFKQSPRPKTKVRSRRVGQMI